jgi:uncharacterized protein (TIGR03435 family)
MTKPVKYIILAASVTLALATSSWRTPLAAQTSAQTTKREAFEVASVKPNASTDVPETVSLQSGGGVRMTGFRLATLIRVVYAAGPIQTPDQFIGGPSWIRSDRFDIVAKAEGDLMFDPEGRRPARVIAMLKTLLEDRFAVSVHTESRRMPAFALRLSRRDRRLGPRLHESTVECPRYAPGIVPAAPDPDRWCGFRRTPGSVTGRYITMAEVAAFFSGFSVVGRPVEDRTGLMGRYDLRVEFIDGPDADLGSLYTAIGEQLGLTFQSERATVPVVVIDRAQHPTPD